MNEPFNSKFDMLGYNGKNLILNLGTSFIVFFLGVSGTLLLLMIERIAAKDKSSKLYKLVHYFYSRIVFSMVIRFLIEGYMELTLMTLVARYGRNWTLSGDKLSAVVELVFTVFLGVLPIFVFVFIWKLGKKFENKSFTEKYGSIYADLNMENPLSKWYNFVFIMRRLMITLAAIFA